MFLGEWKRPTVTAVCFFFFGFVWFPRFFPITSRVFHSFANFWGLLAFLLAGPFGVLAFRKANPSPQELGGVSRLPAEPVTSLLGFKATKIRSFAINTRVFYSF